MRNKILYFLLICFLFSKGQSLAQCPSPTYSISDTICPNQPITISNPSNAISFNWDNGLGDLDSIPAASLLTAQAGTLTYPENMKVVFENGNYYGFVPNALASYVTKYEFGNSLNNAPIITNLPSDANLSSFQSGIEAVKENGKWLLFITMYSSNSLVRIQMDSINQNSNLIFTNLPITGFNSPWSIKIRDHIAFVMNNQDDKMIRLNFNGDYLNTPSIVQPSLSTGFFNNFGFDVDYDCTTNSYIGFGTSFSNGAVFKFNFGNSLLNNPSSTPLLSGLSGAQGLQLMKENGEWHLFVVSNNNVFYNYSLGNNLNNLPTLIYSTTLNGIFSDPKNIQLFKDGGAWIGLISNTSLFNIVKIIFPNANIINNQFSSDASPTTISFSPNALGYQKIELRETYSDGTYAIFLDSVYVNIAPPEADFLSANLCINDSVAFIDNSKICFGNIVSWVWDFGDGTFSTNQNPKHIFTTSGLHTITLSITDNFNQTSIYSENIIIHIKPQADFIFSNNACSGTPITFTDASVSVDGNISSWTWGVNGTSYNTNQVNYNFQTSGNYPISLSTISDFGCIDSITKNINIQPSPIANFSVYNSCIGETAIFNNQTDSNSLTIVNYLWNFGNNNSSINTNPNYQYPSTPSLYNVQLIANSTNGCADTIQKPVRIGNKPQPWFSLSVDTICQNAIINLTDSSFAGLGDIITSRKWDLGDGTILFDSINIAHFYSNPGSYQISLTVKSPTDCDSTIIRNLFVIASPHANYTVSDVCYGLPNTFTDLSTSPTGSVITNWLLNFGDSTQSIIPNNVHQYSNTGNFSTSLIVTSDKGCSDTATINAQVHPLPTSNFNFDKACTNKTIHFNDSSIVANGSITSWNWSFGNNLGSSTLQNPEFAFPNNFAYPVQFICLTNFGCSDTITKYVIVDKTPSFAINLQDECKGSVNQFSYTLISSGSNNLAYLWSFGDSTSSFQPTPTHLFNNTGTYITSLEITDLTNGCADTQIDTILIHPNPEVNFINANGCVEKDITLTDASQISNGTIQNYLWKINGNQLFSGNSIIYNSNQTGIFNVQLTTVSDFGCKDSITKSITIYPNPTVAFTTNTLYGAPPLNVDFTNQSSTGNYMWNFGDNTSPSNLNNPTHIYSDTGNYTIKLYATSPYGCIDSSSIVINVFEPIVDIAVINNSITKQNGKWILKALLRNDGNLPIQEVEMKLNLESRSLFYESLTNLNLLPGNIIEKEFTTSVDAGEYKPSYFCSEALKVNNNLDYDNTNNSFCSTFNNTFDCFNLYPNPATEFISFGITVPEDNLLLIQLYNSSGDECVGSITSSFNKGYNNFHYNTSELSSGVYLIKINYKDEFRLLKFIKE